jgi:aminopeptidase-like protein
MTGDVGSYCYNLAEELFPICRSLSGPGVRETLACLQRELPNLTIESAPSGAQVLDWVVPDEWTIRDAFIADESGHRIVDFKQNNLHVVGYSESIDTLLDLAVLDLHLHSLPEQPDAIPYITSYYSRYWGFCITQRQRDQLQPGRYRVVIDADLKPGVLNYGELILPGRTAGEVLLSTYICHPSMANNELSGPVVTAGLARWLSGMADRRYTYRIIFIPETIGSIIYLSRHLDHLKRHVIAGFNITCVGDDRAYSFIPSRNGNTLSDQVAKHVLRHAAPDYRSYTWLDRGSDERQYCAPGVDLPIATIMRTKFGEYPEYHTSLDDLTVISPEGLQGAFNILQQAIMLLERYVRPRVCVLGEPQLGKRGLYPSLSTKESGQKVKIMMDFISYCDGERSIIEIADLLGQPAFRLLEILDVLVATDLISLDYPPYISSHG